MPSNRGQYDARGRWKRKRSIQLPTPELHSSWRVAREVEELLKVEAVGAAILGRIHVMGVGVGLDIEVDDECEQRFSVWYVC